ncbi:MAG: dienelactone hydrolase family protein, partial [Acidimicrobiaceae bacterium]
RRMWKVRIAIAAVAVAMLFPVPVSSVAAASQKIQSGQSCSTPLDSTRVTSGKGKKKRSSVFVCWHNRSAPDTWSWVAFDATKHTPFQTPASATWRRIPTPSVAGNPQFLPQAQAGLTRLASELDNYWIEVDVEGGKKITAAVWAPKGDSNRPVVVYYHGTGGLVYWEQEVAANLAKGGFVVVTPIWFARSRFQDTNQPATNMPGLVEDASSPAFSGANLELARTLVPVLTAAMAQPGVNPAKLAVSGQSRGGTVALIQAATTPAVKAVVAVAPPFLPTQLNSPMFRGEVWEVLPKQVIKKITQPTLVLGAANDELVPPSSTQDFLAAVSAAGAGNIQSQVLNGVHTMAYSFNSETAPQVRQLTIDFLNRSL